MHLRPPDLQQELDPEVTSQYVLTVTGSFGLLCFRSALELVRRGCCPVSRIYLWLTSLRQQWMMVSSYQSGCLIPIWYGCDRARIDMRYTGSSEYASAICIRLIPSAISLSPSHRPTHSQTCTPECMFPHSKRHFGDHSVRDVEAHQSEEVQVQDRRRGTLVFRPDDLFARSKNDE